MFSEVLYAFRSRLFSLCPEPRFYLKKEWWKADEQLLSQSCFLWLVLLLSEPSVQLLYPANWLPHQRSGWAGLPQLPGQCRVVASVHRKDSKL